MPVGGSYLAFQLRTGALPCFRVYEESILNDILSGFTNLEERADQVADAAFKRLGAKPATDDSGEDMSREAEAAHEEGQAYYEAMTGLRQAMINLLAAGLFHLLEQQLAKLCYDREFRDYELKEAKLDLILKWYKEHLDLDLKQIQPQWATIDELHWLANAVKHAEGGGAKKIRELRPDLFRNPRLDKMGMKRSVPSDAPLRLPLAGDDLFVTEELFSRYATAVADFVNAIVRHFKQNASKRYPCGPVAIVSPLRTEAD